ncbi:VpsF family polysaccharide biosynthesis protein [uncultured Thiodictyon sp.]|uniref:VpsF family polysaccharide biosynthesis protein n=1 Tax=uncultured Thiodictyon sp. TaxID=1846217 RepID=UPI0025F7FAA5|nr:VpsF family polysaccharide biosynthesis protein [uncultured Thiodictyon sp.]
MAGADTCSSFRIVYPCGFAGLRHRPFPPNQRLPVVLAGLGLALYLLISNNLLVSLGIPYDIPGGGFVFKLHPGTYLIALGFMVLCFRANPRAHWRRLFAIAPAPLILTLVVIGVLVHTLIRFGPSGNAFFIDSLLAPALLALVLLDATPEAQRFLFWMTLALLTVNALLAIGESLTEWRLTPYMAGDQPILDDYFRSTALGGHPLNNALRTGTLLIACLILPRLLLIFLIPLLVLALLTFGGRTALVMSLLLLGGWGAYYFLRGIINRTFDVRLVFGLILVTLMLVVIIATLTVSLGLGERIFQNLSWDSSAESRILVFGVFRFVRLDEWLWGMGQDRIETVQDILRATTSLSYLENVWVQLLIHLGLGWFVLLGSALVGMIINLAWRAPLPIKLAAMLFLILISTNNSLASKSQDLAILVAILIGGTAVSRYQNSSVGIDGGRGS